MNEIIKKLSLTGIVPVIAVKDVKDAEPLAQALCDGGLACAEVTFRTAAAAEAIRKMTGRFPEMLVGAGTVLTTAQVDQAVGAGAGFIVSPGLNPPVVNYCIERGIAIIPGCATPSDVESAIALGLDTVKFFPAEAAGGLAMIKALSAPYGQIKFMPTGGITADNMRAYLDCGSVFACGGSWMVKPELVEAGAFGTITSLTKEAVNKMLGLELRHVGINAADAEEAGMTADLLERLVGMAKKDGHGSLFVGTAFEVMKGRGRGANGHIAIGTGDMKRAVYYMEQRGYSIDWEAVKYDEKGDLILAYLEREIGGFGIHLIQK